MTEFDRKWLTTLSVGIGLFGLILFGAGWASTDWAARGVFALFGNLLPDAPDRYLRFTTSLMGAVTFGWAATIYVAFRVLWAMPANSAENWRLLTAAILIWYVIDSAASVANGFAANAVSNTLIIALFLVPVIRARVLTR